jgi:O-antigen/teichoic acid export membrane protein
MGVIIRQGFKAAISNYIGMGLGFISLFILFPLFYEPKELGAIRIFLELATVLSAFALMGTHYSINRFFPYFRTSDQSHHGFFFWALILPLIGYSLLLISLILFGNDFFKFINPNALDYKPLFPILLVLILVNLYQLVTEVSCANHGRTAVPNFMKEVVMRSLIIISGFLFYLKFVNFQQSLWLIVASYLIALIGSIWFLSKLTKINLKPDLSFLKKEPKLKKEILLYTAYLFVTGILVLIIPKIDFFLISSIKKDLSMVAIYSIGFYLATFIEVPKRAILQIATPIISTHMKESRFKEVEDLNKKNGTNQLLISGTLFFFIWMNIDNLYKIMPNGDFYSEGKWVVFYIGLSKMIDAVFCGNNSIIANSKFYNWALITMLIAAFFGIAFNWYFITHYGIIGGAISTIFVMILVNSYNFGLVQFKLKINPLHPAQLKIIAILIFFFLISFIGNWFENPILDGFVRTVLLGSLLIFTFFKSKVSEDFNSIVLNYLPKRNS